MTFAELRHNGGTEFFCGSHLASGKRRHSNDSSSSGKQGHKYPKTLEGPFEKSVILAKSGDCIGWGFDLAHCGGPNSGVTPREIVYFVYHLQNAEKKDRNIQAFSHAKQAGDALFYGYFHKSQCRV